MSASTAIVVALVVVFALIIFPRLMGGRRMPSNVVQEKLAKGAVVLDVRRADEVARGAYPGSLHIPLDELQRRLGEIPRGRPVVAYCAAGVRAGSAVQILKRAGFEDVVNGGGLSDLPRR